MALRKGDTVTYRTDRGSLFEAIVMTRHWNGDYTVKATFHLDSQRRGVRLGSYLGFKYRMSGRDLTLLHKAKP